jgi:hypothetical protein
MRDFLADWNKWTRIERISAMAGITFLTFLVPILASSTILAH